MSRTPHPKFGIASSTVCENIFVAKQQISLASGELVGTANEWRRRSYLVTYTVQYTSVSVTDELATKYPRYTDIL